MIEMLIVIAVLGILAAALLATIDPFEQMKKARDTTLRNSVIDYLDAITRYYAVKGKMPWHEPPAGYADCVTPDGSLDTYEDCTKLLMDTGELKTGFSEALGDKTTQINLVGAGILAEDPAYVVLCFKPDSKSIRNAPETKCTEKGQTGCTPGGATICYWCTDVTKCIEAGP